MAAPPRFLSGQETALVGGSTAVRRCPRSRRRDGFERGVGGQPTLVQNVETLAHLALIARYGAAWFRAAGTRRTSPGTMLCTLQQADGGSDLAEAALGTPLGDLLDLRSGRAVLVGGYHGAWLPAATGPAGTEQRGAAAAGASAGAGVLAALPAGSCGLAETPRVARYLALESAGQCGPCLNGLPRIATRTRRAGRDATGGAAVIADLERGPGWSRAAARVATRMAPSGSSAAACGYSRLRSAAPAGRVHGGRPPAVPAGPGRAGSE